MNRNTLVYIVTIMCVIYVCERLYMYFFIIRRLTSDKRTWFAVASVAPILDFAYTLYMYYRRANCLYQIAIPVVAILVQLTASMLVSQSFNTLGNCMSSLSGSTSIIDSIYRYSHTHISMPIKWPIPVFAYYL